MNCPNCRIELDEHIKREQAQKAAEREQKEKELKNLFDWRCNNGADEFGASIKKAKIWGGVVGFLVGAGFASLLLLPFGGNTSVSLLSFFLRIAAGLFFGGMLSQERGIMKRQKLWQQFKDKQQFKQQC